MNALIVAEIGLNHNGSIELAKQLIDMAVECGCDAVKFQKRTIEIVYTPEELAQPRESPLGNTNGDQKRGLEFGRAEYDHIDSYCVAKGIEWFASAWDLPSLDFLEQYKPKYHKVASAMLTHLPFVEAVAQLGRETFVSTGMSTQIQIRQAASIFRKAHCPFVLMHTTSTYPAREDELNLNIMHTLRAIHPRVGYSGHEVSPTPSIIAAVLGAEVIERHITLDRAMYGSDQAASLERRGLEILVKEVRRIETYLGGYRVVSEREQAVADRLRYFAS